MVEDGVFGPVGQIIIYSTIAVTLVIALLIIACFVTPGCIGYECVRPKKKQSVTDGNPNDKINENLKLNDVSYRSWRVGSLYDTESGTIWENSVSPRLSINSNDSQIGASDPNSIASVTLPSKQNVKDTAFPTELTLSLRYLPYCEGVTASKFVIGVETLLGLPPKQYNCTLEPYVTLDIYKQSWTNRKKQKLYSFKTKGIKHTANPVFKESFVISGANPQDIKEWMLNIEAYDHDRYANHTKLSELQVQLKDAKRIFLSPETHLFNFQMKTSKQEYGSILLGISYLPTAQRLSINVMKARNINFMPTIPNIQEFNPFVRILMLNGRTSKRIKKLKTKVFPAVREPEFNETLTFDLPPNKIDSLQFLIILCSKSKIDTSTMPMMNELPSDSEDSVVSFQKAKDVCIGKVALGKGVRGTTERLHWFSIFQNPRKLVTVWHSLK
ncbi:hypothetical protein TKK_0014024 [Trichogramma kaykai]|uniref:C2 domain-containing protein n=1 Tax=Trichogramma kaykai TaxID=54128 RepID=A0ABD2WGA9_9HYME